MVGTIDENFLAVRYAATGKKTKEGRRQTGDEFLEEHVSAEKGRAWRGQLQGGSPGVKRKFRTTKFSDDRGGRPDREKKSVYRKK